MARIHHVKSARQRYEMVPTIDPDTGEQKIVPVIGRNGEQKTTKKGKPVVQRLTHADKSKPLPMPKCEVTGETIEPGMAYKWVQPKSGPYGGRKRYRLASAPNWRPFELSSSKMATAMAAVEDLEAIIGDATDTDTLRDMASTLAEEIRSVAEEYRESQQNMVDGFGHDTYASDELGERADEIDSWADEIEYLDFDELDDDLAEIDEDDLSPDDEQRIEDHWGEQRDRLLDAAGNMP